MSGPLRVLIINPSGEEIRGVVGQVCEDQACVIEEMVTKECADLFVSGPVVPTAKIVEDLPSSSRGYDFLYILGGPLGVLTVPPGTVDEQTPPKTVAQVEKLVLDFHAERKPILGCCLGGQLIARTFGGQVDKMPKDLAHLGIPADLVDEKLVGTEWGWLEQDFTRAAYDDPVVGPALFVMRSQRTGASKNAPLKFAQWHSDCFSYPPGAVELSTRSSCSTQAFRVGETTYGFQYHIEVDQELSEQWLEDYCVGADTYEEKDQWKALSERDQAALKAEHKATVAEGTIARAEAFTRTVTMNLLHMAARTRDARAALLKQRILYATAVAAAAAAAVAAFTWRRRSWA
eukprot:TRINITY_DN82759_c0_g1_i1.p1 TRINITY_DN82759_c0_g1~~TRINITY_DN82759_c0_g1_i1.p1  ORF type:complete len:346 (+),score=84.79 TRINITY_DN82759_c0_g1_i1:72-1109(+)